MLDRLNQSSERTDGGLGRPDSRGQAAVVHHSECLHRCNEIAAAATTLPTGLRIRRYSPPHPALNLQLRDLLLEVLVSAGGVQVETTTRSGKVIIEIIEIIEIIDSTETKPPLTMSDDWPVTA